MDGGAWWATVHGVAKSRTRLSNFTSMKGYSYQRKQKLPSHVSISLARGLLYSPSPLCIPPSSPHPLAYT